MPDSGDAPGLIKIRFPDLSGMIEPVFLRDESFRILCRDYGDCVAALGGLQEDDSAVGLARTSEYTELRDELESEIREWLTRIEVGHRHR